MLKVTNEQLDEIALAQRRDRRKYMMDFYRETAPDFAARYDDEGLSALIEAGEEKADAYGIEHPRARLRFIGLMLVVSPTFDELPEARRFLSMPDFNPEFRVDMLFTFLMQRANELAAEHG